MPASPERTRAPLRPVRIRPASASSSANSRLRPRREGAVSLAITVATLRRGGAHGIRHLTRRVPSPACPVRQRLGCGLGTATEAVGGPRGDCPVRHPPKRNRLMPPTIVLVHGAFAESASWTGVAQRLHAAGLPVVAAANPLRGVADDAAAVSDLVRTIDGPVVLVGHSYGGSVISNVAGDAGDITALVYVAAFAPEAGESCFELSLRFPGSTLGDAVRPIPHKDGSADLVIAHDRFHDQFCADLPATAAGLMAATQRPIAQAALEEQSGPDPLWRRGPAPFLIGPPGPNNPAPPPPPP